MPETQKSNDNMMNALAYPTFGIVAIILLVTKQDDDDAMYHAFNGLFLWLATVAVSIVLGLLASIPVVGCFVGIISIFVPLAALIYGIILAVKVNKGEKPVIPYITDLAMQAKNSVKSKAPADNVSKANEEYDIEIDEDKAE